MIAIQVGAVYLWQKYLVKIVASLAGLSETIESKLHQVSSFSNIQTSGHYTKDFVAVKIFGIVNYR